MFRLRRTHKTRAVSARSVALYGVLTAVMLVLGFVERQFPIAAAIPGIRLGLSNVVLLYCVYLMGARSAWALLAAKVALGGLLFSGATGAMYALSGGVFALTAMLFAKRLPGIGVPGVSVLGAISHIAGQILMSRLLLGSWAALVQAPILLAASAVTGALTGLSAAAVMKALKRG